MQDTVSDRSTQRRLGRACLHALKRVPQLNRHIDRQLRRKREAKLHLSAFEAAAFERAEKALLGDRDVDGDDPDLNLEVVKKLIPHAVKVATALHDQLAITRKKAMSFARGRPELEEPLHSARLSQRELGTYINASYLEHSSAFAERLLHALMDAEEKLTRLAAHVPTDTGSVRAKPTIRTTERAILATGLFYAVLVFLSVAI